MIKVKVILSIGFILLSSGAAMANIINVPDDQPTIQAGINAAVDGDTVLVQPGNYVENINFSGKNIIVGSLFLITQDTTYISQTIIDGDSSGSVVSFTNGEDSTAVLSGFTITNGNSGSGGGIYCRYSSPKLENLIISSNTALCGAGAFCRNSSTILKDITISNNSGYDDPSVGMYSVGGGIYIFDNSNPTLMNVTISENYGCYGGGIFCKNSHPSLVNVVISNNTAGVGGGIHCYNSSPSYLNVSIVNNMAIETYWEYSYGGGICSEKSNSNLMNVTISGNSADFGGGIICANNSNSTLVNSILWNDAPQEIYFYPEGDSNSITIAYSDIQNGQNGIVTNDNGSVNWLDGNIDAEPLFANPENGDFHLTWTNFPIPDSTKSPCIDTGDPNSPLDPDSTRADMGAYYFDQSQQGIEDIPILSVRCMLYQNYPNPFSSSTTISFILATKSHKNSQIKIYNIKGQLVKCLACGESLSAEADRVGYSIFWDGKDKKGNTLSSGIYLYKLIVDNNTLDTKKCLLLR